MDRDFYYWMQRELEKELTKIYRIHAVRIWNDMFCIWFLNNADSVSIPLDIMKDIYNNGKSMEELAAIIDGKYVERIKK